MSAAPRLLLAAATLLAPAAALAGNIQLDPRPDLSLDDAGAVSLTLDLRNNGDEGADNVSARLLIDGAPVGTAAGWPRLAAGDTVRAQFRSGPVAPGAHAGVLKIGYEDANGYPFSAVHPLRINRGPPASRLLNITGPDLELPRDGRASGEVSLRNLTAAPLDVTLAVAGPDEVWLALSESQVTVPVDEPRRLTLRLHGRGALAGSLYRVLLLATTRSQGTTSTEIGIGTVRVVPPSRTLQWALVAVAVLAGLATLALAARALFGKTRAAARPL